MIADGAKRMQCTPHLDRSFRHAFLKRVGFVVLVPIGAFIVERSAGESEESCDERYRFVDPLTMQERLELHEDWIDTLLVLRLHHQDLLIMRSGELVRLIDDTADGTREALVLRSSEGDEDRRELPLETLTPSLVESIPGEACYVGCIENVCAHLFSRRQAR
jgi:hypothetical protein